MNLTIFDLDNTLIAGDSDYVWGQFLVSKNIVDAEYYTKENDRFYEEYKNKTLDIHEYQRFVLTPLIPMDAETKARLHQEFMDTVIAGMRLGKADALIEQHKKQGDRLLIITATNSFITGPIGPWLGIDEILATEPEVIDGTLTGNIAGTPCFQEGKIERLKEWLLQEGLTPEKITFYSDSINDLPLLEHADVPVAVDPDDLLEKHARSSKWPILSLR
ncbi:MAG: HAD family hydrolase [Cellvibrionaceae bacterium]